MNTSYLYYATGIIISIFYLANIIPIILLRNRVFSSLMYKHSIVICISFSIITLLSSDLAARTETNCLLLIWIVFVVGTTLGGNYVVKCTRIVIQSEWNHYYSSIFKVSESRSNLTTSESDEQEEERLTRFILKGVPLLDQKNSLILFASIIVIGLSLPIIITLTNAEYRNHPNADCNTIDVISIAFVVLMLVSYLIVIIASLVILIKRRKTSKNMYVVKHLKHIALSWVVSLVIYVVMNLSVLLSERTDEFISISTMFTSTLFIPPFVAEIVMPQIKQFRDSKHLKRYENMKETITSIGDLIKISFSKTLKIEMDVEDDDEVVSRKKYLKNVGDCLRFFVIDHQRFQGDFRSEGITTSILLEKLHFIQMVNRSLREEKLSPGHIYKIWKIFFAPSDIALFRDIEVKIPNRMKNEILGEYFSKGSIVRRETATRVDWIEFFLDNIDDWRDLYNSDNSLGELNEEFVKDMVRMENDTLEDEGAYERCSNVLLEIYEDNIDTLDKFVLEPFKESNYFHILIQSIPSAK